MSVIEIVSLALVGLFLLVAVVRLFRKPLKPVSYTHLTLPTNSLV